jgi:hypothetical protein
MIELHRDTKLLLLLLLFSFLDFPSFFFFFPFLPFELFAAGVKGNITKSAGLYFFFTAFPSLVPPPPPQTQTQNVSANFLLLFQIPRRFFFFLLPISNRLLVFVASAHFLPVFIAFPLTRERQKISPT